MSEPLLMRAYRALHLYHVKGLPCPECLADLACPLLAAVATECMIKWNGQITDVAITSRPMTDAEIAAWGKAPASLLALDPAKLSGRSSTVWKPYGSPGGRERPCRCSGPDCPCICHRRVQGAQPINWPPAEGQR